MNPLASVSDVTARGVAVEPSEEALLRVHLEVASDAVRAAAGCPISQATSTVVVEGGRSRRLRLPGPPVTAVDVVEMDGETVTDWTLKRASSVLWRRRGWQSAYSCEPSEVEVTYTHGLPTVPADIVDLVCRMALAALVAARGGSGEGLAAGDVRQEQIGDYMVSYGSDGRITQMELPAVQRDRIAARFGGGAAVVKVIR